MKKLILLVVTFFAFAQSKAQCPITITPSNPTTCAGVAIVLQASAANSYTWSPNAGGANTATVAVSPTVTTSYTVTAFTGTCSASAVVTVNVNPLPTVTVTSTTLCSGYADTLFASGAISYTWSTGAQPTNSIVISPTNTGAAPTTSQYTVVGEDANGCMNFAVSTVTVLPSPTITVNSEAICSGTVALTPTTSATTFTWSTNAGGVNTQTVNVVPASTTVYTVTGGWATNSCTSQATSTVWVNSSTVSITPPAGTNFCTDQPYQFTGNANPGPILFWQWYCTPSAGVVIQNPNQSGTIITFPTAGGYTLMVKANNALGCIDSVYFPLTVTQTPTVITTPVAPIVCQGGPGTVLYAGVTPAFGPTTYTWTGSSLIQYANGDSVNINPPNTGVYTYTVVGTQNGCTSEPTTITATVSPPPQPVFYISDTTICSGSSTTFTCDGLPTGVSSYTWSSAPTGGLGTNSGEWSWATPVYNGTVDTTFVYYCDIYVPGCPAYPTYSLSIFVIPTPIVDPVSDTLENCNGLGDSLRVTSVPDQAMGTQYYWWPNYFLQDTVGNPVFADPPVDTWYYVTPIYKGCIGQRDSIRMLIGDTTLAKIDPQYLIVCTGQPDTLVGLPMLNQLNNTYQYFWEPTIGPNAPTSVSVTGDTIVINPVATQIYTLTVTGVCVRQNKTEITIYVNNCPTVVPSFTMNTDTICVNKCIYFEDLTWQTGNVLPLFYQWLFVGGTAYGSTGQWTVLNGDSALYAATDSTPVPKIKVCYKINSSLNTNGVFPVQLWVSHGVGTFTSTVTHYVKVDPGPLANAGANVTINLGDSTQLNGNLSTGNFAITNYSWSPPDSLHCDVPPWPDNWSCPRPWANPSETTHYFLTVTDKNGCVSTDSMTVFVDVKCFDPFVPSAFSPNGDGKNDILYVRSNCLQNFVFKVFDRWGEKVFETTTLNFGWDGTFRGLDLNAGVFMWTLEGFLADGKEYKAKGTTTIIK